MVLSGEMVRSSTCGTREKSDAYADWDVVGRRFGADSHYLDPFLGELKRKAYMALFRRWKGIPATGSVLKTDLFEEATGQDALLTDVSTHGAAVVVGMDISLATVRRAQGRDIHRRIRYVVADVRHPPFSDGAFVSVLSPSTLDHFADPHDLGLSLRKLAKILAVGGQLIVTLDNRQNIFDPLLRLAIRLGLAPYYIGKSYRVSELRSELEAAGLKVEDTTAILHNPRLLAVTAVRLANHLRWRRLIFMVRSALEAAQALENTRWCYLTGSFIAAKARRDGSLV